MTLFLRNHRFELYDVITGLVEPVLLDGAEVKGWRIYPLEFKKDFIQR